MPGVLYRSTGGDDHFIGAEQVVLRFPSRQYHVHGSSEDCRTFFGSKGIFLERCECLCNTKTGFCVSLSSISHFILVIVRAGINSRESRALPNESMHSPFIEWKIYRISPCI